MSSVLLEMLQMHHLNVFLSKVIHGMKTLAQHYLKQKVNTQLAKVSDIILQKVTATKMECVFQIMLYTMTNRYIQKLKITFLKTLLFAYT